MGLRSSSGLVLHFHKAGRLTGDKWMKEYLKLKLRKQRCLDFQSLAWTYTKMDDTSPFPPWRGCRLWPILEPAFRRPSRYFSLATMPLKAPDDVVKFSNFPSGATEDIIKLRNIPHKCPFNTSGIRLSCNLDLGFHDFSVPLGVWSSVFKIKMS